MGETLENIYKWLEEERPMYLIIGFKHDGYRDIPRKFVEAIDFARSVEEVYEKTRNWSMFRVFFCQKESDGSDYWITKRDEYFKANERSAELAELERLKKKYNR
jgi:hypothetical protein